MRLAALITTTLLAFAGSAQAAKRPDLAVTKPAGVPAAAGTLAGFDTSVVARNLGRGKARATRVAFFLSRDKKRSAKDPRLATEVAVGKLRGGKRTSRRARLVIPSTATGRWFVLACVDPTGAVRETKEGNNCAASRRVAVAGPDPLQVSYTKHPDPAAQALSATGPDGSFYSLVFEDSSETDQFDEVTLTPISGITPAPGNVAPAGGVLIEPTDRLLGSEATLTVIPAGGLPPSRGLVGFAAAGDGSDFHLQPARVADGAVEIRLTEFGVHGFGTLSGTNPSTRNVPVQVRHRFAQDMAVLLAGGSARAAAAHGAETSAEQRACDQYLGDIRPRTLALRALPPTRSSGERKRLERRIAAVVREAVMAKKAGILLGTGEDLSCFDGMEALFIELFRRVFDEAYKACKAAGGDPFEEGQTMIGMLRQAQLLGTSDDPSAPFGSDALDKIVECSLIDYDVGYSSQYETFTDGGWSSTGTTNASARFRLGEDKRTIVSMNVPNPSPNFFGECSGTFLKNDGGTFSVRGDVIVVERYVVGRGLKPTGEVDIERKLRVEFDHSAAALWRIDCGGDVDPWDLAADLHGGVVFLPTDGGTGSAVHDTFPTTSGDTCVECERTTGTVTVLAAPK